MEEKDKSGLLGRKTVILTIVLFFLAFIFEKLSSFFRGVGSLFFFGVFQLLGAFSLIGALIFMIISAFRGPLVRKKAIASHLEGLSEKRVFGKVINKKPTTLSFKVLEQVSSLTRQYYYIDFLLEDHSMISVIATGEQGNVIFIDDKGWINFKSDDSLNWLVDFDREVER